MKNVFYLIILCSFSLCAMQKKELSNRIIKNLNNSLPKDAKYGCLLQFFGYVPSDLVSQKDPVSFCYLCGVPNDIRNSVLPNLKKEFTVTQIKESTTYLIMQKKDVF